MESQVGEAAQGSWSSHESKHGKDVVGCPSSSLENQNGPVFQLSSLSRSSSWWIQLWTNSSRIFETYASGLGTSWFGRG